MEIEKIKDCIWEIKKTGNMKVPVHVYAKENVLELMKRDRTFNQISNVASLPGIINKAMVMPDGHEGYGFPIGGVAAFDMEEGIISPGGVGFDINCGVRLIATNLTKKDVIPLKKKLVDELYSEIPSGVGSKSRLRFNTNELHEAVTNGVNWAIEKGYGTKTDATHCEEDGCMQGADFEALSEKAIKRGKPQFGTLGAGNHFLEIDVVQDILDTDVANKFNLRQDQVVVQIHSGSRGFGHQICSDSIQDLRKAVKKYDLQISDPQLVCAPLGSDEADKYIKAMKCAVNYAFINRHMMMHWTRHVFDKVFGKDTSEDMKLVYDVCHNIAKFEKHKVNGKMQDLCIHRKGATRAFAKGREELPNDYINVGQPVLIPGSMGTSSYVLVGQEYAMENTWGSTCHGAGRVMSRKGAITKLKGRNLKNELMNKGIYVKSSSDEMLLEEAPDAYKNIDDVISSVQTAGISRPVARMVPIGVVKG